MKTIQYRVKSTTAGTEYRQTTSWDSNWILAQCQMLAEVARDCQQFNISEGLALNTPRPDLPKMSSGRRNTPATLCQGIVDNFNQGQYNLSNKQMEGLVVAFKIASELADGFEAVEFEEVTTLPKIPINTAKKESQLTTLTELFDFENWEVDSVTLKRRK